MIFLEVLPLIINSIFGVNIDDHVMVSQIDLKMLAKALLLEHAKLPVLDEKL